MPAYDAQGREIIPPNPDELELLCEIGGQFDECWFYLEFRANDLDREAITTALGLTPTRAWNPHEPHLTGNSKRGVTRVLDYGRWSLKVAAIADSISNEVQALFAASPAPLGVWREICRKWNGRIALVGRTHNWNREFSVSREVIAMLAERALELNFDAYFIDDAAETDA